MLTEAEIALVNKLGECADEFCALVRADRQGGAEAALHDLDEFIAHMHDLQHAVMCRSTRRDHPEIFGRRLPLDERAQTEPVG